MNQICAKYKFIRISKTKVYLILFLLNFKRVNLKNGIYPIQYFNQHNVLDHACRYHQFYLIRPFTIRHIIKNTCQYLTSRYSFL